MTLLASLTWSGRSWLWPVVVLAVVALLGLAWSYRTAPRSGWAWACGALKALGFAAVATCLLEPLWTGQRAKPGANLFALVADNSASLQVRDHGASQSRAQSLQALLGRDSRGWQETLADHFEVRRFGFDSRLNATRDFGELTFDGRATALGSALRGIVERFQGRPLAGVLLFTDGNATDIRSSLPALTDLPPVYPVVIGRPGGVEDVAIEQVKLNQTAFEDTPVSLQANVAATGVAGETIAAQLVDASGKLIEEGTLRARKDSDSLTFRFQWRPERPGLSFYRLRAGLKSELTATNSALPSREATLANNVTVIPVDRGRGPYRVLYVAGRPNWEFKFLNRAVQADDQIQLVGLIRVALREPKFEFRGRAGETSNPLYRGFDEQPAGTLEHYDQPVLIRVNTRDEFELRQGFPRTPEELYGYEAVILGDVEAGFFAPDQMTLLQKFVSERGGGLLMLGGMESFRQGQYQRTAVGDLLPVYLDRVDELQPSGELKFNLTREGWLEAWARLRDNESDERDRLRGMSGFQVFNPTREIKPGASVIATATDARGREYPALVTQRFGRGRTAALMIGDFWRWGMQSPEARRDMDKAWRQFVRWLVADVPKRVELSAERPTDEAGGIQLQVRARDEKFQPLDDASVTVEIKPELSEARGAESRGIRLRAEPSPKGAGLYETSYVPRLTGGYRATAYVTNAAGIEVGQAEAGWNSDLAAEEFRSLQPNTALLETLARRTGGELVPAGDLATFVRRLPERRSPVMESWTTPAWHTPALFGFALACLAAEWGIRRWKGMP